MQGFGLTETTCGQLLQENTELGTNTVGRPMTGVEVRLINWDEGNYMVTDQPHPRGEVIIGGESVAKVYIITKYTYYVNIVVYM